MKLNESVFVQEVLKLQLQSAQKNSPQHTFIIESFLLNK